MTDEERWAALCEAQAAVRRARWAFLNESTDRVAVLARALEDRDQRLDALDYLRAVDGEDTRRALVAPLVAIVATADRYFEWADAVLLDIEPAWLAERIDALAEPYLADWEGHSALMWLYGAIGDEALLERHVARCAAHPDPDIRSLAEG